MRVRLVDSDGRTHDRSFRQLSIAGQTVDKTITDLYSIANGVFILEDAIHAGIDVAAAKLQCYSEYSTELADDISSLVEFMLGREVEIAFDKNPQTFVVERSPQAFGDGYACS